MPPRFHRRARFSRRQRRKRLGVEIEQQRGTQRLAQLPIRFDTRLHRGAVGAVHLAHKGLNLAVAQRLQDEGVGQRQPVVQRLVISDAATHHQPAGRLPHELVDGRDAPLSLPGLIAHLIQPVQQQHKTIAGRQPFARGFPFQPILPICFLDQPIGEQDIFITGKGGK